MTREEEIVKLKVENAARREQVRALLERVQELEARRAKDSHNSSKPPSSGVLKRKTNSLRTKSGKKAGGQLGQCGETLHLVEHRPYQSPTCQTVLADAEHQALRLRCPRCAHVSVGAFPAEASSRAQYGAQIRALAVYLVEQQHLPLGRGTLMRWIGQAALVLQPVERHIKDAIAQAPALHHDKTSVRRGGRLAWAHVTSMSRLTYYAIHPKRGGEALEAIGVLPDFEGGSVHDGWGSDCLSSACRHALCNVHHLRELTFLDDLAVPFDNNQAERDLRDLKAQHKVSGCFRSERGADAYATIRGYLATLRKQGVARLAALHTVFAVQPVDPASAWPGSTPVHTR
jgi:transposase